MTNETNHNQPAAKLRDGSISATLWEKQGEHGVFYNTTIVRTYKDADDKYQDTNTFSGTDLLRVAKIAERAYEKQLELRAEKNRSE